MNVQRWQRLLRSLGATPETETFDRLIAAYAEKHRAYHTARHIDECLSLLDEVPDLAASPAECECALWFRDAIYDPVSQSNEERSAQWASEFLERSGVSAASTARVCQHILATTHEGQPSSRDSALVVDIDLAILGADPARYEEFERDVRKEYQWVPSVLYRRERAAILRSFLDRPRIYHLDSFFSRFEQNARTNLTNAVGRHAGPA
jgi:predicted metal-dependent HD superfamily phosphohydrolase